MPVVASPTSGGSPKHVRRPSPQAAERVLSAARGVAALAPERSDERDRIDGLAEMVVEVTGTPIDERGVAATLESRGLRDTDAVERYGKRDIFELADEVFVHARAIAPGEPTFRQPPEEAPKRSVFALAYLRGVFSFLPLLAQVLLLVTIGYSQWGWIRFTLHQASAVALGVGLAMIGTAGFVQVLGYLGPMFSVSGKDILARRITYRTVVLGLAGSALFGALVCIPLLATGAYPAHQIGQAVVYDALVSALWLVNGALYMLKRQYWILAGIAVSVGVVALVLHASNWGIYAAQWLGLGAGVAMEFAIVALALRRRATRTAEGLRKAAFPRPWVLLPTVVPLFVYGIAYFGLLLSDRGVAWSAGNNPLPIWFSVRYELGLDVALFGAAVGIAFLECGLQAFTRIALPQQDRYSGRQTNAHNRWFVRFFARQVAAVVVLVCLGGALMIGLVTLLHSGGALGKSARYYSDPVTVRVFVLALIGYGFLALGIASSGVLFNVARPWDAARAAAAGLVVDLAVGIALSRTIDFSYAAVGLTAGCAVFALLAGFQAARVLRRADYYLYAAF